MTTHPARVKMYSSSIPLGVWGGLSLVAIALVIMWALPAARLIVGSGLVAGVLLAVVLLLRRRRAADPHEEAAPLHLRD